MIEVENWMHKIRELAPLIEKTEYEVLKSEALVKKTQALLKVKALGEGIKTTSAQDTYAESKEELFDARLKVASYKSGLSALKVELRALEIGFEQWRTEQVSARKEQARYGA
mgnify:FL=1|jgi:predicted  nucleic acid-binding Zn-ribbon protein|tara:strand:+ start:26 stop:361 length:336 start_codon:yes stop_codon:yes gene_type:complete